MNFNKWNKQAKEFYKGAQFYREQGSWNLAAFCMHQAFESGFISLISSVLGYKINVHNLSRMLQITLMVTDELKLVFKLDTEKGVQLFELLRAVYSNARYSSSFALEQSTIEELAEMVPAFLNASEKVYQDFSILWNNLKKSE